MPRRKSGGPDDNVIALSHDGKPAGHLRPPSQRGKKLTPSQREAFERGQEAQRLRKEAAAKRDPDEPSRWDRLLTGDLDARDLDDEELARMQCKGWDGKFYGRPPNVPNRLSRAMKDEILRRGERGFAKYGQLAIKTVAQIMQDPAERGNDRLRAATIILERCYGKVPEEVRATVESAWDETYDEVATEFEDAEAI